MKDSMLVDSKRSAKTYHGDGHKANDKKKRQHQSTAHDNHPGLMDIDATQTQWVSKKMGARDKTSVTYYNYGKKGYLKRDYYSKKKWRLVLGKETTTIEEVKKVARVREIAAASYIQDDLEDDIDRADALEAALAELDMELDILAESEASSEDPVVLANRLDAEFTDSDQEELVLRDQLSNIPNEGLIEIDDKGKVVPPYIVIGIVENQGLSLV